MGLPVIAGNVCNHLDLLPVETEHAGVPDEVEGVLVMRRMRDVVPDIVQHGGRLEQLA